MPLPFFICNEHAPDILPQFPGTGKLIVGPRRGAGAATLHDRRAGADYEAIATAGSPARCQWPALSL